MESYSLFQNGIFRKLREGKGEVEREEFFFNSIQKHADKIGARFNAKVVLNAKRVWEAQELWENDPRALITDKKIQDSPYPCEYKHAAFLCFWLRRRLVVQSILPIDEDLGIADRDFVEYSNEYLAFYISLHLVLYHKYFPLRRAALESENLFSYDFPTELAHEVLVMLHHKNVSPHALYLFFKALVQNLHPPSGLGPTPVQ